MFLIIICLTVHFYTQTLSVLRKVLLQEPWVNLECGYAQPSLFLIIFLLKHCRLPSVIPEADLEDINTGIEEDLQAVT